MLALFRAFLPLQPVIRAIDADAALRNELLRMWVARERVNAAAAQVIGILIVLIGIVVAAPAVALIGTLHFIESQIAYHRLRRLSDALDSSPDRVAREELLLRGVFFICGFIWAIIALPAYSSELVDAPLLLLAVISPTGVIVMASTTCLAPRVYRASLIGFAGGMAIVAALSHNLYGILLAVATAALIVVVKHMAATTASEMIHMYRMQEERNAAIRAQQQTIVDLDTARRTADRMALTDGLTGLLNREAFMQRLASAIGEGRPFALMLLDVDLFKNVNDTMGHHVGDAVLVRVGEALRGIDSGIAVPARLGGDEFALILMGAETPCAADNVFQTIEERICIAVRADTTLPPISVTAGSARFPAHGTDQEVLLTSADLAQREAKRIRRGTHQNYQFDLKIAQQRESDIAALLAQSINDKALDIRFQPLIDLATGRIAGAEALTHFSMPALAAFNLDEVFEVAERRGLGPSLADITFTATTAAILRLRSLWPQDLRVSINLSQSSLKLPARLVASLTDMIRSGVPAEMVRLEITENAISGRGLDMISETLDSIVRLGFSLSLDDFGTGQGSMAHLRTLPIREIKIDKQFVAGVCSEVKDRAIISGTLSMCRHLGIDCVAEGVEREDQAMALASMGIHIGQGFLWARAMPAETFVTFASSFSPQVAAARPATTSRRAGAA